jgi:hypothetical protein
MLKQVQHDGKEKPSFSSVLQVHLGGLFADMRALVFPADRFDVDGHRLVDVRIRRTDTFVTFAPLGADC